MELIRKLEDDPVDVDKSAAEMLVIRNEFAYAEVANWQTQQTQNLPLATTCRFDLFFGTIVDVMPDNGIFPLRVNANSGIF